MIKRLPDDVVKKISAGEVIENPASCVRELVENSLDAGSTNIKVKLQGGGIDLIEVSDNGSGISKDEIKLAVERFTTSKISNFDDLKNLKTLGFRGEALYAISQVSLLTIRSNVTDNYEDGWECSFEGGKLNFEGPYSHPRGTTVIVKDLFYNIPVRRKFLLSKREESKRVFNELIMYALWHYNVAFTFQDEEELMFELNPGDFGSRVVELLGQDFVEKSLFLSYEDKYMKISGFVSKPETLSVTRYPKQIVLLNGRGIKSDQVKKAVFRAYDNPTGNPSFVFRIEISPEFVDFNIHPQKKEVKISTYVRFTERLTKIITERITNYQSELGASIHVNGLKLVSTPHNQRIHKDAQQLELGEMFPQSQDILPKVEEKGPGANLWQAHNSFIFAQTSSGIMIIDQHAAHERIIYDKLKKRNFSIQSLLFPILVPLTSKEKLLIESYSEILSSFGFEFRYLDENSLVIDKVPSIFKNISREEIKELLDSLEETPELPARLDLFLKTVACKAAVKFGDALSKEEMSTLIDELFTTDNPFNCPHGRPTIYFISLEELKSRFER
ncbi:MAG: DNA mismatch repair endonuclease MutL [candidate division WOR-3 bacterium]